MAKAQAHQALWVLLSVLRVQGRAGGLRRGILLWRQETLLMTAGDFTWARP